MNNSVSHCSSKIDFYLERYCDGKGDDAFHGLLELDKSCLPDVAKAFRSITDSSIRALLLEVIWQHREPTYISLLAEALFDDAQEVWQESMDGLVTLACSESLEALQQARERSFDDECSQRNFHKWLDEAISQTEVPMHS